MKKVKVCEKCSGLDVKALKKDIKALGGEVKIGCFGKCNKKHPECAGKVHGKIDGEHVVCATEAEFRAQIKEALAK